MESLKEKFTLRNILIVASTATIGVLTAVTIKKQKDAVKKAAKAEDTKDFEDFKNAYDEVLDEIEEKEEDADNDFYYLDDETKRDCEAVGHELEIKDKDVDLIEDFFNKRYSQETKEIKDPKVVEMLDEIQKILNVVMKYDEKITSKPLTSVVREEVHKTLYNFYVTISFKDEFEALTNDRDRLNYLVEYREKLTKEMNRLISDIDDIRITNSGYNKSYRTINFFMRK